MSSFKTQKTILITGASSGIGLELVKLLRKDLQCRIVATALPSSLPLFEQAGITENESLKIFPLDISDLGQIVQVVYQLKEIQWMPDILVNNAGISYRTTVEDMDDEDDYRLMKINYFGAVGLIRRCLPHMRQQRYGRIINVSSVAGMMAMPTMGAYSATKWALEGLTETLWYELKPWNIRVSLVEPGFINSLAFKKVLMPKEFEIQKSPYYWYYHYMTHFVEKLMGYSPATSQSVAQSIYKIMKKKRPRLRNPITIDAYFFDVLRRLTPRFLYHRILYHSLPQINHWLDPIPLNEDLNASKSQK